MLWSISRYVWGRTLRQAENKEHLRLLYGCSDADLAKVIGEHWNWSRDEVSNQSELSPLLLIVLTSFYYDRVEWRVCLVHDHVCGAAH